MRLGCWKTAREIAINSEKALFIEEHGEIASTMSAWDGIWS
jgi:hypothetical protein